MLVGLKDRLDDVMYLFTNVAGPEHVLLEINLQKCIQLLSKIYVWDSSICGILRLPDILWFAKEWYVGR